MNSLKALGCLTLITLTANVATATASPSTSQDRRNAYVHAGLGYANHPWQSGFGSLGATRTWKNGNGGFAYGFDLGYKFHRHFSVEAGYYKPPKATATIDGQTYNFTTYAMYAALKGSFPLTQEIEAFAKFGLGYQKPSSDASFNNINGFEEKSHAGPMFGVGGEYKLDNALSLGLQYLYFDGSSKNINDSAGNTNFVPKSQLVMATLGYKFHATEADTDVSDATFSTSYDRKNTYVHAGLGHAAHPWQSGFGPFAAPSTWKNGNGGLTYGFDLGYNFYRRFSVEAGYYKLPKASLTNSGQTYNFTTCAMYLGLKGSFPLTQEIEAFAKFGLGYQKPSSDASFNYNNSYEEKSHASPMFGVGGEYKLNNDLSLGLQYLYFDGSTKNLNNNVGNTNFVPKTQLVVATIGYKFNT